MNREALKALGLTEEQIESVMASHGSVVNATKGELESIKTERDDLKGQLTDRDTQLNDLSSKVKDNDDLTAEIERLKGENATATSDLQAKLDKQAFDHSLEKALTGAKVRNPKALQALLDSESLKLDGDKILGLDGQLEAIKESDPYLFEVEQAPPNTPTIVAGGNPNGGAGGRNPFTKEHWNLTEQGKLFREDPDMYNNLKAQSGK